MFLFFSATRATIQLTEKMAHAGADAVMVVTPSYYKGQMTVIFLKKEILFYEYIDATIS